MPVPQPISRTSRVRGWEVRVGTWVRMDESAKVEAVWTKGFSSHDDASALNRELGFGGLDMMLGVDV